MPLISINTTAQLSLGLVWKVRIEDENGKSISFSLVNVFVLFLRMRIEVKKSLLWKPNLSQIRILIPLVYVVLQFTSILILFPFIFPNNKQTLKAYSIKLSILACTIQFLLVGSHACQEATTVQNGVVVPNPTHTHWVQQDQTYVPSYLCIPVQTHHGLYCLCKNLSQKSKWQSRYLQRCQ